MRRHGGMIFRAARSVLGEAPGAEDVVQATFLTLARKAGALGREGSVAGWLYQVAIRLAREERRNEQRRKAREKEAAMIAAAETTEPAWSDADCAALHEELANLADTYRAPVVLHHLEGKSYEQAAAELGCNLNTFGARLTRAREKLRKRLAGRGVAVGAAALAVALGQGASAAELPASLVASTCKAAGLLAAGKAIMGEAVSAKVIALTKGALNMLFWAKVKTMATVCAVVIIIGGIASPRVMNAVSGETLTAPEKAPPASTGAAVSFQNDPCLSLDKQNKELRIQAVLSPELAEENLLESLLISGVQDPQTKKWTYERAYESAFVTQAQPTNIHLALLYLGLRPGVIGVDVPRDRTKQNEACMRMLLSMRREERSLAPLVEILVEWREADGVKCERAECFLYDRAQKRPGDRTPWCYTGSVCVVAKKKDGDMTEPILFAELTRAVAAAFHDGSALLNLPFCPHSPYKSPGGFSVKASELPTHFQQQKAIQEDGKTVRKIMAKPDAVTLVIRPYYGLMPGPREKPIQH